jgi:hypothetical protein
VQSYGGAWPQAAVEAGPGFVAVGFMTPCCADATYESEPWMSVVWTSPNGVDWEVLPDLETFGRSGLRSIAVDEAGSMLAVGYEVLPPPDDAVGGDSFVRAGRAWRSDNGRDWYPVGSLGGEDLFEVIWTQSGWYVAGQGDGEATIWHSTDLATWDAWSLGERGWFERLAAGADGTLVAIACIKGADLGCHTTVFADPGAEGAWKRAEELGVPRDVIAWGDGFAAVGSDRDVTRGLAWLSQDGVTWQASEIGDGLIPWTVADVDGVLVAGGEALAQEAAYEPAVWRSVDGVHWLPAATLEAYADQAGGNVGVIIGARRGITAMGSGYAGTGTALTWIEAP